MKRKFFLPVFTLFMLFAAISLAACNAKDQKEYRRIEYHLILGENNPLNVETVAKDEEFTLLDPIPDNEYCNFAGWFTESTFENQITTIPIGEESEFHVYAKWSLKERYTIFLLRGNSMSAGGFYDGEHILIDKNYTNLTIGDLIIFYSSKDKMSASFRRIVEINEENGIKVYITKADSKPEKDSWEITEDEIVGRYVCKVPEEILSYGGKT